MFGSTIVVSPDEMIGMLRAYADAGVEELIIQWFGVDDLAGLQILAEHVLPHLVITA